MNQLLWESEYKCWKLAYAEGHGFFAYKDDKEYVKDWELRWLAVIANRTYPDRERLRPCDAFERLKKLSLIDIRWSDTMGYLSRYCYFDITWEPYSQIPPRILAHVLIDGIGQRAFYIRIYDTCAVRSNTIRWKWDALKKVMREIPTEELPEFLTHDYSAVANVAGDILRERCDIG